MGLNINLRSEFDNSTNNSKLCSILGYILRNPEMTIPTLVLIIMHLSSVLAISGHVSELENDGHLE